VLGAGLGLPSLRLEVHTGFLALLGGDRRRSCRERIVAVAGLREGDDVADGLNTSQKRHHTVPAEGDAAVRRSAELEALQQETELGLGVCLVQAHQFEDPFLDIPLVDTDGAAADFVAVAHDVVGVGQG
jgi:hypothetical protein